MSAEQTPDGFSLQLGTGLHPKESTSELFLKTATNPTFPFLHMKIIEDETIGDVSIDIKVNKKIYEFLKTFAQSEDIVFYFTNNGGLSQWTFDMIVTMKILSELEIMPKIDNWTKTARECLTKVMNNEKFDPVFNNENALASSKELLSSFEILDHVEKTELLFLTADEALKERVMDSGTLIYRLAMAIYHSDRGVGRSILTAMDEPSSVYLKLIKSSSYSKWESKFSEMMSLPLESRIKITKVLTAFTVASYVYHKTVKGDN